MIAVRRQAREWVLNLGALLGLVCIVWTFAAAGFGLTPLVFRSGSMAPAITTGALALAQEVSASDLRVGDVVSLDGADGVRVTHRIEQLRADGDAAVLTLRGHANRSADAASYRVTEVDRVLFDIPGLGYVAAAFATPAGVLLGVGIVGGILWLGFGPALTAGGARRTRLFVAGAAIVAISIGAVAAPTVATLARWSDTANLESGSVRAYAVPVPGNFTCSGVKSQVNFTWAAVPGADSYMFHYGPTGQSTTQRTSTNASLASKNLASGVAWVEAKRSFGSVTWTSAATKSISYSGGTNGVCG